MQFFRHWSAGAENVDFKFKVKCCVYIPNNWLFRFLISLSIPLPLHSRKIFRSLLGRRDLELWLRLSPLLANLDGSVYTVFCLSLSFSRSFSFYFHSVAPSITDLLLPSFLLHTRPTSTAADLHACSRKLRFCTAHLIHARPLPCAFNMRNRFLDRLLRSRAAHLTSPTFDLSDQLVCSPPKVAHGLHAPPQKVLSSKRHGLDSGCYPMLPLSLTHNQYNVIVIVFYN